MMSDIVLWTSASRFHDWRTGGLPKALLQHWLDAGVIGVPEWFEQDDAVSQVQSVHKDDVSEYLLALKPDKNNAINFRCGGVLPHEWWLSVMCPPFDVSRRRVAGYGMINLRFPRGAFTGGARSDALLKICENVYSPHNCEYSSIHPLDHIDQLKLHQYENVLVLGPMMAGVFWAQFLGPGHIEVFEKEELDRLPVARKRWSDSRGLFFAVTNDIGTADTPETEELLIRYTNKLRASQMVIRRQSK